MRALVTLRLDASTRKRLDRLAKMAERSRSELAAKAVKQFVELNEWQIAAIQKGVQQADSGQFIDHAKLKAKWEKKIAAGDADIAAGRLLTTEQVFAAVAKQRAKRVAKAKKRLEWSRWSAPDLLESTKNVRGR